MAPPIIIQDFAKICRCCMEVASYDIFKTYFENEQLCKLLAVCTSVRVPKNDTLPKNICQSCLQQLISSYIFYQKVNKVQTAIHEISKVLDKAKTKKNVINDHDYHTAKKLKAALKAGKLLKEGEEGIGDLEISPVKIEVDRDAEDYIENEMEDNFENAHDGKITIKQQDDGEDQEYWFEESNEQEGEGQMESYEEINNIFDSVKIVDPSQFHGDSNEYVDDEEATELESLKNEDFDEHTIQEYDDGELRFTQQILVKKDGMKKKNHFCQVCSEAFYSAKELNAHSEESNHPQKFCTTCYEFFHTYSELIKHCMETKHPRPQTFKCAYCFKKLESRKLLTLHMRAHAKVRGVKFNRDRDGYFPCQVCKSNFDDMSSLRQHLKENVGTHMACSICARRFSSMAKLNAHSKVHMNEKPYECEACGLRFNLKNNMERHMKIHTGERPYHCRYCNKGFIQKTSLIQHERSHHTGEMPYLCSTCGKMFTTAALLKKHIDRHHGGTQDAKHSQMTHECELCGKMLSCKATLYSHVRNVHEKAQKVFPCVICGKVLKTKTSLELHVNYHTGNCPFKCDTCGKAFTNATTLKSHMLIHTDERPYACHICNKAFKQKPHLNTHILTIHTGIKPFACSYCDKTFALNGNLSQHLKTHTGCDSPFICSVCNKAFYFASRLRKHEKIHLK